MKVIAWHLPQFHEIPENNKWWGEGYTEWTNLKKAEPLFKGHNQPRVPLNGNYYNMLDKETMEWQCKLAEQYNIFGFCYYHYWFNGKLLLEKPVENLLRWKDIPQKFCLSWANDPWVRSWHGSEEVLLPQVYGSDTDWKEHFEYLLPFFLDDRYIRIDNKPVFVLYRTQHIPRCDEMLEYFNKEAQINNLDGLYFIETFSGFQNKPFTTKSEAVIWMEPMISILQIMSAKNGKNKIISFFRRAIRKITHINRPFFVNYDEIVNFIKKREPGEWEKKEFLSAFTDWDNSPRRKRKKSLILKGASPEKFREQIKMLMDKTTEDIIFVNAWNEWTEGTYLEPDEKNGYAYLEILKDVTSKK